MKIKIKKSVLKERVRCILRQNGEQISPNEVKNRFGQAYKQLINTVRQQAKREGKKTWSAFVRTDKLQIKLEDGTTMIYDFIDMGPQQLIAKVTNERGEPTGEMIWDGYDWKNK